MGRAIYDCVRAGEEITCKHCARARVSVPCGPRVRPVLAKSPTRVNNIILSLPRSLPFSHTAPHTAPHRLATFRVDTDDWKQVYQTDGSCMDKYAVAYDRYVDDDTRVQ